MPDRRFPYPDNRQDDISVRWTGKVRVTQAGKYTFFCASDDGQRLYIDGRRVVDNWQSQGVTERSATVTLTAGLHDIKYEYFQGGGGAEAHVYWQPPGGAKEVLTGSCKAILKAAGLKGRGES